MRMENDDCLEDHLDRLRADLIFDSSSSLPPAMLVPPQAYHGTYGRR
jgi:hypothetical protein